MGLFKALLNAHVPTDSQTDEDQIFFYDRIHKIRIEIWFIVPKIVIISIKCSSMKLPVYFIVRRVICWY